MTNPATLTALRSGVALQQRELRAALAELGTATRSAVDPRLWIRDRPFVCIGGALVLGLWLGGRARNAP